MMAFHVHISLFRVILMKIKCILYCVNFFGNLLIYLVMKSRHAVKQHHVHSQWMYMVLYYGTLFMNLDVFSELESEEND